MSWMQYRKSKPLFAAPVSEATPEKNKHHWGPLPFLGRAVVGLCTLIGACVLLVIVLMIWGMGSALDKQAAAPLPKDMVLSINFADGVKELPGGASLSDPFGYGPPTLKELIDAIEAAKTDKRVKGIVAKLDDGAFQLAQVQELRKAIKDFRSSGKFAYLYSSSLGEMSGGLGRYLLASSFDQIWMQPLGVVSIPGINTEMPFFRATLDKLGVTPDFFQRKEYKSAYENMTNEHMSDPNRAVMQELVGDLSQQIVKDLSDDMQISPQAVETLINKGLFTAQEALDAKLIDKIAYEDELKSMIMEKLTKDPESKDIPFTDINEYVRNQDDHQNKIGKTKVALVYAVGAIMPDAKGGPSPLTAGQGTAAADEISKAILDAADDEDVEAVVLRIDSPGGSPVASEDILRAVEKAQEEGKPVVVSMGPTAASGGYWIASYADQIFVMPGTLTGSIGVVGGKFALNDLWSKWGVNWEGVSWGTNSHIWSFNKPFSPTEAERINAMLDQVYDAFIERVAKGREMSKDAVEKVAKGHVWTGARAVKIGLADQIGGLNEALDYTATLLSKKDRSDLDVEIMPKPKTPFEKLVGKLQGQSDSATLGPLKVLSEFAAPFAQQIEMMQHPDLYSTYDPITVK